MVIFSTEAQYGVLLHKDSDFEVEETDQYQIKSQVQDSPPGSYEGRRPSVTIDVRLLPEMGGDV